MIGNSRGIYNLTHLNCNCRVTYGIGPSDSDILTFAAEMQFSNMLADSAHGSIIFEVNYAEGMPHARKKAKESLWGSYMPRSSVVVLWSVVENRDKDEYRDLEMSFEVLRRNNEEYGEFEVYETGFGNFCVDSNAQDLIMFA